MIREVIGRLELIKVATIVRNGARDRVVGYVLKNTGSMDLAIKHSIDGKIGKEILKVGETTLLSSKSLCESKEYYSKIEYVGCKLEKSLNGEVVALITNRGRNIEKVDCGIYNESGVLIDIQNNIKKYLCKEYVNREIESESRQLRRKETVESSLYLCRVIKFKCNGDPSKGKVMAYMLKSKSKEPMVIVNCINGQLTKQTIEPGGTTCIDKKHLKHFYAAGGNIANAIYVSGEGVGDYLKFKNSNYSVNDADKVTDIYTSALLARRIVNFLDVEHIQEIEKAMKQRRVM